MKNDVIISKEKKTWCHNSISTWFPEDVPNIKRLKIEKMSIYPSKYWLNSFNMYILMYYTTNIRRLKIKTDEHISSFFPH